MLTLGLSTTAYQLGLSGRATAGQPAHAAASQVRMDVADVPGLVQGQKYGPTAPAHPAVKPWTNLETQEGVQLVKAKSDLLRQPLLSDMANDEIFVSKDSIHILKHGRPVETEACLVGRRGPGGWLAGAGRSSGQPEACPGATRTQPPEGASWPQAWAR